MKKTTKALFAGAAGITLLTAGVGTTFASWQATANITSQNIQTGDLRLDFATNAATAQQHVLWSLYNSSGTLLQSGYGLGDLPNVGPGYKLTGVVDVATTLRGETLTATLSHKYSEPTAEANSAALVSWLNSAAKTVKVTSTDPTAQNAVISANTPLSPNRPGTDAGGRHIYTVTITIEFPATGFPPQVAYPQAGSLYLGDLHLTLLQQAGSSAYRG